jgi:hypothetical protein
VASVAIDLDDDVGQIQDFHERVELGAHSRSHLLGVVFTTDCPIKPRHFGLVTIRSNVAILCLRDPRCPSGRDPQWSA